MCETMAEFDIPHKIIRLTRVCVKGSSRMYSGRLSGTPNSNRALPGEWFATNTYADNIEVVETNLLNRKETFVKLEHKATKMGLKINEGKTRYMHISRRRRGRVGQSVKQFKQRRELIRRRISLRSRSNPFDFPDQRFRELFRLDKRLVRNLMEELRPLLEDRKSMKGVDFESKIFCALRYYAVGSYQRCVGWPQGK
ncbi:unnamed protein product [Ceutorhynchus assimilis]|uniref:Uncharacterized protein n=1 Tax=Ceutorhynchus assimilis TaxID=467358 RepID=A0A9N9QQL1_9CUCU|nr:unnamed protein product [Ceutorhynchus assimilis]